MEKRVIFLLLLFATVCYFPLFLHLDVLSLRMWDEARRAVNALEMATNGNWLVTHYDGKPEMWGTKPPLLIWCQAICMKLFGYNEFALRLPPALAGVGTIAMLTLFAHRVLKKPLIGVFAGLILVTSRGFIYAHITRTGDFDSLLVLFENLYLLLFFCFFVSVEKLRKTRFLYLAAGAAVLAGLTKGIAAFFFVPGIFLFCLFEKELLGILKNKHLWAAVLLVLGCVAGFYVLRNAFNPGYLDMVWEEEIGGRFMKSKTGHKFPWYHYIEMWIFPKQRFAPWVFFLPLGIFAAWRTGGRTWLFAKLLLINSVFFMTVVSAAGTKLAWYQAPVFPGVSLLVAIGLERLCQGLKDYTAAENVRVGTTALLLFGLAFWGYPYFETIQRVYNPVPSQWDGDDTKFGNFMKIIADEDNYTIAHAGYNSHATFYRKAYNLRGYNIQNQAMHDFYNKKTSFGEGKLNFMPGDTVMMCESKVRKRFGKFYEYETIREWDKCVLRVVKGKVPPKTEADNDKNEN